MSDALTAPARPWLPAPHRGRGAQAGVASRRPARQEQARRHVVGAVLWLYVLLLVEGALRKWLLPEYSQWLFFVRDPLLLWIYAYAWRHRLWPRRSAWLALAWGAAALGAAWLLLQVAAGPPSPWRWLLGGYGWRSYFLYVPLALLVAQVFTRADLWRLARLTLWTTLPVAVLVAAQFHAPIGSPLNVGIAADAERQFRGAGQTGERTRPMGLFASVAGQQQFVGTAFALLLAASITPPSRRRVGRLLLAASAAALLACLAFSGSRGTLLQCLLAAGFALLLVLLGRGARLRWRALALTAGLAVLGAVAAPLLFPVGVAAFAERWAAAAAAESAAHGGVVGRALYGLVDFLRLIGQAPPLGWGLGFGGNASITLRATIDGVMPGLLAETDFARHMVDLGPLAGSAVIVLRVAAVAALGLAVLRATRRHADPWPLLLFSYAGTTLLLGQVTGQGTITAYAWLFTGLCLAACRHAREAAAGRLR